VYKRQDKAREMFLKAIEINRNGDSYYFLGEIEKILKNFEKSEEYFRLSINGNTTKKYKKNAYWNIIVFTEQKDDYNGVVLLCKEMWLDLKSSSAKKKVEHMINKRLWTDNQEAVKLYTEGMSLKNKRKHDDASLKFTEALNIDSNFLAPKMELGMIEYNKGNLDEASGYLTSIVSSIPFYAEVQLILGKINYNRKNYYRAIEYFNKADEYGFSNKNTEYYIKIKRATAYYVEGNYDKAIEDITSAIKIKNKRISPLMILSAIHIKKNEYDAALKILNRANSIKRDNSEILYQIGSIYYKKDDWRYMSYFDRLFNIRKKKTDSMPNKYYKTFLLLINNHFKKNNFKRVSEIISFIPETFISYEILLISAKTDYHTGNFDSAIDKFKKISLNDEDRFILIKAYARSGRKHDAMEALKLYTYNQEYMKKAREDQFLSPVMKEIDAEKRRQEEEHKKIEEKQIRLEQERIIKEKNEKEKKEEELKLQNKKIKDKNNQIETKDNITPEHDKPNINRISDPIDNQNLNKILNPLKNETSPDSINEVYP